MPRGQSNNKPENTEVKTESTEVIAEETVKPATKKEDKYTDAQILDMVKHRDRTYVDGKDPSRFYLHAERDSNRVEELKRQGFVVETGEDAIPASDGAKHDGTGRSNIPRHILMSRPMELDEKIRAIKRDRFEDMAKREQEEAMEKIKKEMDRAGITSKLKKTVTTSTKVY